MITCDISLASCLGCFLASRRFLQKSSANCPLMGWFEDFTPNIVSKFCWFAFFVMHILCTMHLSRRKGTTKKWYMQIFGHNSAKNLHFYGNPIRQRSLINSAKRNIPALRALMLTRPVGHRKLRALAGTAIDGTCPHSRKRGTLSGLAHA